jgi:hypothetical protein
MSIPIVLATFLAIGSPRIIGLVEIPSVLGALDAPVRRAAVMLRTEPLDTAPAACVVRGADDLETRAHGYEEVSAVVYDSKAGWYGLRCRGGERLAWLAVSDAGTFRPLEELVRHGLAYLTAEWDRALYQRPHRTAARHTMHVDEQEPDIAVADTAVVNDELWLLVVVFGKGRCTADEPGPVLDAGWTLAHAPSGESTAWFYSRGC